MALNSSVTNVYATFITTPPQVTKQDLVNLTILRSEFTTYYPYSTPDRKLNIKLCASKINGTTLKSGEEFSFNNKVGKRTEENGFKLAKIIFNGSFIDGIGGGVCQVSTTLYNCALLSGLKITEHHSHSLAVSYIEPSFDAMVSGDYADLNFVKTCLREYTKTEIDVTQEWHYHKNFPS